MKENNEFKRSLRVLLAKPGLDGHDRGIKIVARALRDSGAEVIYLGLRSSIDAIVSAAVEEDVDVLGLGFHSGGHLWLVRDVVLSFEQMGVSQIPLAIGGTIPVNEEEQLRQAGVAKVFPVGSKMDDIVKGFFCLGGSGER